MRPASLLAFTLVAAASAGGCVTGTYNVHRSALTPHASPQLHPVAPMDSIAQVGLGASSLGHIVKPEVGDPDASVEVPGTQFHGDARFRISDALAIGFLYENGLDASAHKPKGNLQPDVDAGNVSGRGVSVELAIPTPDQRLTIGLTFETMLWLVPWVEWRTCIDDCSPQDKGFTYDSSGVDLVSTLGVAFTPTFRTGKVTWFGGLSAREHPTIQQKGQELGPGAGGDVISGTLAWTASAGAQVDLGAVKGSLVVYQTLTRDPVQYGPSAAALVVVPLGKRRKAAAAPPMWPAPVVPSPPIAPAY